MDLVGGQREHARVGGREVRRQAELDRRGARAPSTRRRPRRARARAVEREARLVELHLGRAGRGQLAQQLLVDGDELRQRAPSRPWTAQEAERPEHDRARRDPERGGLAQRLGPVRRRRARTAGRARAPARGSGSWCRATSSARAACASRCRGRARSSPRRGRPRPAPTPCRARGRRARSRRTGSRRSRRRARARQFAARSARAVASSSSVPVRPAQKDSSANFSSRFGPMRGSPRTAVLAIDTPVVPSGPVREAAMVGASRNRQVFGLGRDRRGRLPRNMPSGIGRVARPYRCAPAPDFEPDSLARCFGHDRLLP